MNTPDKKAAAITAEEGGPADGSSFEIAIARKTQQAMIPQILPSSGSFSMDSLYLPSQNVSGDQFDAIRISEKIYAFLIFDVSGQGICSALLSSLCRVFFSNHLRDEKSPKTIIEKVNANLTSAIGEKFYLTAFLAFLDQHDNRLTYCNAGHPFPILYRNGSHCTAALKTEGTLIGLFENVYFEEQSLFLEPGDRLVMFTDGILHTFGENSGRAAFEKAVIDLIEKSSPDTFISQLKKRCLEVQKTTPAEDDVAVLVLNMEPDSASEALKKELAFSPDDYVYIQIIRSYYEVEKAVGIVLGAMDRAGYGDDSVRRMKVSLPEIVVNAVYHGNKKDPLKKVIIGHKVTAEEARVSVMDEGEGFNPNSLPNPTNEENLTKENGRGVYITRHYCDKVEWNESGSRTTLTVVNNNNRKA
ncbi:MAG: SpoIIE family protein phosphatase [Chitinispirillales bacterium]|jgi:anti-sigma regulatory factor (Ser/Thr protein kinase)|nr:SpoIIE family protein phosphatase [Chitinispirillales bacterium]